MPLTAGNFEHGVVAARPDQMYGWPGITCTKDREILVSASERMYHTGPLGRTVVMRSTDGGRTWSLPQEIYNSEIDDRDPSLLTTPDGTIILTSFSSTDFVPWVIAGEWLASRPIPERWRAQWQARVERQGLSEHGPEQCWLMRSEDGGRTWSVPMATPTGQHAGPGVLNDGRLIYLGRERGLKGKAASVSAWESTDKGDTWEKVGEIRCTTEGVPATSVLDENHLVEVSSGHLVAMFRSHWGDRDDWFLYQSHSYDEGRTWSEAQRLPVWGHPPYLTVLSSGAVLCVYGHRRHPLAIRAILSYDEGQTWDHENFITIYQLPEEHDFGYPVSVELSPGEILTVYYYNRKYGRLNNGWGSLPYVEDAGGILYTRWTLE